MKLLLHICCGVCAIELIKKFRQDGYQITGYFYNPNIHPYLEFKKRMRAVEVLAEQEKIEVYYEKEYGLKNYLRAVVFKEDERCGICYDLRLKKTAEFARANNFDAFSSTLIISPQQNQALIKETGLKIVEDAGIKFIYDNVTDRYAQSKESAKQRCLYSQKYCGSVYSEYERYHHKG